MKMLRLCIFMCVFFVSFSPLNAENATATEEHCQCKVEIVSCPKTYVIADQISFLDNKIIVNYLDLAFFVPELHSDQTGLYFDAYYNGQDCGPYLIPCPYSDCHKCNAPWASSCGSCGRRIR